MDGPSKTQRLLEGMARGLVLAAVIAAPWLFGGAEPWAHLFICALTLSGAALWMFGCLGAGSLTVRAPLTAAGLLLLGGYVMLQWIPLPDAAAARLGAGLHQDPVWEALSLTPPPAALSLAPAATLRSALLFAGYLATFLVLANTVRDWSHLRSAASWMVYASLLMAVLAVIHKFTGSDEIYWFHAPRYGGSVFGPFSNRNHLAAHLNMVLGLAFGLLLSSRRFYQVMGWPDWRDRLSMLSSREGGETTLRAFAALLLAGAVGVSLSRGAMLSLALTFTCFGVLALRARRGRPRAVIGFVAPMLLLIATILWFGSTRLVERLGSLSEVARNPSDDLRYIVTRDCLGLVADAPLFGTGFGSFRHVFPLVQTPPLSLRWLHAHNDWMQLLVEGGIVGAALFLIVVIAWLRHVRARLPGASEGARYLTIGALFGGATIAIHSLFDYSLHKPANAFLLAALAGLGTAGLHARRRGSPHAATDTRPLSPARSRGAALGALLLCLLILATLTSHLRGELAVERFHYLSRYSARVATAEDLVAARQLALAETALALRWGSHNADSLAALSRDNLRWGGDDALPADIQLALAGAADAAAVAAVQAAPADYLAWLALARTRMAAGNWDAADLCVRQARTLVRRPGEVRMFTAPETPADDRQIP